MAGRLQRSDLTTFLKKYLLGGMTINTEDGDMKISTLQ